MELRCSQHKFKSFLKVILLNIFPNTKAFSYSWGHWGHVLPLHQRSRRFMTSGGFHILHNLISSWIGAVWVPNERPVSVLKAFRRQWHKTQLLPSAWMFYFCHLKHFVSLASLCSKFISALFQSNCFRALLPFWNVSFDQSSLSQGPFSSLVGALLLYWFIWHYRGHTWH